MPLGSRQFYLVFSVLCPSPRELSIRRSRGFCPFYHCLGTFFCNPPCAFFSLTPFDIQTGGPTCPLFFLGHLLLSVPKNFLFPFLRFSEGPPFLQFQSCHIGGVGFVRPFPFCFFFFLFGTASLSVFLYWSFFSRVSTQANPNHLLFF